jgi:hypothetical protein
MNSFLNYSKLAITTLITSSLFVACSDKISENTVDTQYSVSTANIRSAGQAVDLGLPSGTKWANMNIGATSETDNGILFIWGDVTGTQTVATTATSYLDVTNPTSVSDLFDMYKAAEEKVGTICDTTLVSLITEPLLIDLSFIADTVGLDSLSKAKMDVLKMSLINSFVKSNLEKFMATNKGFLEATLTNEDFALIIDWDGTKFIERFPKQNSERDTLDYYKKFDYTKSSIFSVEEMGFTEAKYYDSPKANNYSEIKDQFGVVMRKDYTGGDVAGSPIYSIIADANHDPATANWGSGWQMPTTEQIKELIEKCTWEFVGNGYKVTGPNKNSIFLPAAGYRFGDKWFGNGNAGYYATGEIYGTYHFPSMAEQYSGSKGYVNGNEDMPNVLTFQHGQFDNSISIYNNLSSSFGFSIRPVAK